MRASRFYDLVSGGLCQLNCGEMHNKIALQHLISINTVTAACLLLSTCKLICAKHFSYMLKWIHKYNAT